MERAGNAVLVFRPEWIKELMPRSSSLPVPGSLRWHGVDIFASELMLPRDSVCVKRVEVGEVLQLTQERRNAFVVSQYEWADWLELDGRKDRSAGNDDVSSCAKRGVTDWLGWI